MSEKIVSRNRPDTIIVCKTIPELRGAVDEMRAAGSSIGLVPTMGALHEGHLSLIQIAKDQSDAVVVSIFVNPTQFAPGEDFDSYPRKLQDDIEKCEESGVAIVFAPDREEIYEEESYFSVELHTLNDYMCGGSRPGFFEGIVQIVNKLFNIIEPDTAVFGQKDIQQVQILKRMVREFNHGVDIITGPIQRANDGLALSSRNAYLSEKERLIAPGLYRSLQYIEQQIKSGVHTPALLIKHQISELEAKGFKIDYLNVFMKKTLQPVHTLSNKEEYIIAGAAYMGNTRLIDNILIEIK